jgi:hypothetical protein
MDIYWLRWWWCYYLFGGVVGMKVFIWEMFYEYDVYYVVVDKLFWGMMYIHGLGWCWCYHCVWWRCWNDDAYLGCKRWYRMSIENRSLEEGYVVCCELLKYCIFFGVKSKRWDQARRSEMLYVSYTIRNIFWTILVWRFFWFKICDLYI